MSVAAFRHARDLLLDRSGDIAAARRDFRWPAMEHFNYALDWFDGVLAQGPDGAREALRITGSAADGTPRGGAGTRSFARLSADSSRVANGLRALGVRRGDRILLMLGNEVALWEAMLAAMKLGAVVIPASTLLTPGDLADRFARGRVRHVICGAADAAKFDGLDPSVTRIAVGGAPGWLDYAALLDQKADFAADGPTPADAPLLLYFTSGTTAKPKLVLHDQCSYPVGHLVTMHWLGLRAGDLHLNISSPGWAKHAWSCVFAPWNAGAAVFINNQPRFDAAGTLEAIAREGVTTFCAPPTVWRMLVRHDMAPHRGRLREVCSAGEPLNPEVIAQVGKAWGLTIREGYGQTETTLQVGYFPGMAVRPGSMGVPAPGYDIRLLDADGAEAEAGEIAIALDPPPMALMRGYLAEDGTLTPPGDGRFYSTGDVAGRDAEGHLSYVGRADDVFKASDYRISPFELESVLVEHPDVVEAAVVPAPDAVRTSVPKAFLVLSAAAMADAAAERDAVLSVFRHLRARLAPYKRVRRIEVTELPKTISGKIRRVELRQLEARRFRDGERAPAEYREEEFPELG